MCKFIYSVAGNLEHVYIDENIAAWLYATVNDETVFVVHAEGNVSSVPKGEPFPFNGDVKAFDIG